MKLRQATLNEMAARASTLYERVFDECWQRAEDSGDATPGQDRLTTWCQNLARGRWERFDARLAWDGLDRDTARSVLGGGVLREGAEPPSWPRTLAALVEAAAAEAPDFTVNEGVPFEHVLRPFVRCAAARWDRRVEERPRALAGAARASAHRELLELLCRQAGRVLHLEFTLFRSVHESAAAKIARHLAEPASDELYRRFAAHCHGGGLAAILTEYAVLARQLAVAVDDWVDAMVQLERRLAADRRLLARTFTGGEDPGRVVGLDGGLSDRHNGGRTVAVLTFSSGLRLVYKPKDLAVGRAYFDLLERINATGELPPFRVLRVLVRDGYGWVEHVERRPCRDREGVGRFYERTGRLLGLIYALDGYDCHYENILAEGEQPVLIDLETLMNPSAGGVEEAGHTSPATVLAARQLFDSVLRTGLLPTWSVGHDGRKLDITMLGSHPGQDRLTRVAAWKDVNSDRMRFELTHVPLGRWPNLPFLEGGEVTSEGFEDRVVEGFRQMYGFLLRHREALLDEAIPAFRPTRVRYVPRITRFYADLLRRLCRPRLLRHGADWSLAVDGLCRGALFFSTAKPPGWELFPKEQSDLMRLDIPFFTVAADSRDVADAGGRVGVAGRFETSPYQRLLARWHKLSPRDLETQVSYIRSTFLARSSGHRPRQPARAVDHVDWEHVEPLDGAGCLAMARAIGRELSERTLPAADGSVTWIALDPLGDTEATNFKPIGTNLHSGTAGVAVFLSALARATGDGEFRSLAYGALRTTLQTLGSDRETVVRAIGLGANLGLGSIVYALALAGHLLEDEDLLRDAAGLTRAISPEAIARDDKLDVIFGAAGCILALLKLYRLTGEDEVLAAAVRCGRHILAQAGPGPEGRHLCPTMDGGYYTGFSHGAAGVACALTRLAHATGQADFEQLARAELDWEEERFCTENGNYPDFRSREGETSFLTTWCHGAPGIGLSRMAIHALSGEPGLGPQIERCVSTTGSFTVADLDHLCCGNFGRIDVLLEHGRRYGEESSTSLARRKAAWIARRVRESGGYQLFSPDGEPAFSPGFFTGVAGIGYTWLRLADPGSLPSVLLFD